MTYYHKFVDYLKSREFLDNTPLGFSGIKRYVEAASGAEVFDFGDLLLESDNGENFDIPVMTDDEESFWEEGLIAFPSDKCWFEFIIGGTRSAVLFIVGDDGRPIAARIERGRNPPFTLDGIWAREIRLGGVLRVILDGETEIMKRAEERFAPDMIGNLWGSTIGLVKYLVLMLNSQTTEVERVDPPPKLVKAQLHRGQTPLRSHTIVTIVPSRFRARAEAEGEQDRRPPRLHWRRSHLRHYENQTPTSKWMQNHEYKGIKGWWVGVIPRFLVGRRELGEVTHEYKFKGASNEATVPGRERIDAHPPAKKGKSTEHRRDNPPPLPRKGSQGPRVGLQDDRGPPQPNGPEDHGVRGPRREGEEARPQA